MGNNNCCYSREAGIKIEEEPEDQIVIKDLREEHNGMHPQKTNNQNPQVYSALKNKL